MFDRLQRTSACVPVMRRQTNFDFVAVATACNTQNEFNRLAISLENSLTPQEIASIARLVFPSCMRERVDAWLRRLSRWEPELFAAPKPYQRRSIVSGVELYSDPRMGHNAKGLIVAFCGNAGRLMVPVCLFLQATDARLWDVLVLRAAAGQSYMAGIEGVADNFTDLVHHFETTQCMPEYRRVLTFGTSGGSFAALWAAVLLRAQRGIAVGGRAPPAKPLHLVTNHALHNGDHILVYGEKFLSDYEGALGLRDLFGGRLLPVPDIAQHNVLGHLMKHGLLAAFLEDVLS